MLASRWSTSSRIRDRVDQNLAAAEWLARLEPTVLHRCLGTLETSRPVFEKPGFMSPKVSVSMPSPIAAKVPWTPFVSLSEIYLADRGLRTSSLTLRSV